MSEDDDGPQAEGPPAPKEAELEIDAGAAAKPVIARVLAIAATRAGFSLDRMSDGVLMGDVIAAGTKDDFAEGRVGIEIEECGPSLCLRVGPFQPGGAQRMVEQMDLPGMGVSIAKLADRFEVVEGEAGEFISVEISPGVPQPA